MKDFINQIEQQVSLPFSLEALDIEVEIAGELTTVNNHICLYINSLTNIEKINLIKNNLENKSSINENTFNYESINAICEEFIINSLLISCSKIAKTV